jgi:hypothetical protein
MLLSDLFAHSVNCKCFQYPKSIVLAPQYRIVTGETNIQISVFFEFGKFYKNLVNLCKFCQNISQIFPDILFKLDIYRNLCNYFNAFISARNHLTVSPGTDHSAGDWPFQIGIMRSVSDLFAHWVNYKCFQYPKSIVLAPQYRIVYPGESFKKSYYL